VDTAQRQVKNKLARSGKQNEITVVFKCNVRLTINGQA